MAPLVRELPRINFPTYYLFYLISIFFFQVRTTLHTPMPNVQLKWKRYEKRSKNVFQCSEFHKMPRKLGRILFCQELYRLCSHLEKICLSSAWNVQIITRCYARLLKSLFEREYRRDCPLLPLPTGKWEIWWVHVSSILDVTLAHWGNMITSSRNDILYAIVAERINSTVNQYWNLPLWRFLFITLTRFPI